MATLRPATGPVCRITIPIVGRDKSFVDDLNKDQSTVSMRVAFVLRSTEVQLLVRRFVRVAGTIHCTKLLAFHLPPFP